MVIPHVIILLILLATRLTGFTYHVQKSTRTSSTSSTFSKPVSLPLSFYTSHARLVLPTQSMPHHTISSTTRLQANPQLLQSISLPNLMSAASTTPQYLYFVALCAAGFGIPVSEDALCIFAGTLIPTITPLRRLSLFSYLFAGVVLSDVITFTLGRLMREGMFDPLKKLFMGKNTLEVSGEGGGRDKSTSSTNSNPIINRIKVSQSKLCAVAPAGCSNGCISSMWCPLRSVRRVQGGACGCSNGSLASLVRWLVSVAV